MFWKNSFKKTNIFKLNTIASRLVHWYSSNCWWKLACDCSKYSSLWTVCCKTHKYTFLLQNAYPCGLENLQPSWILFHTVRTHTALCLWEKNKMITESIFNANLLECFMAWSLSLLLSWNMASQSLQANFLLSSGYWTCISCFLANYN